MGSVTPIGRDASPSNATPIHPPAGLFPNNSMILIYVGFWVERGIVRVQYQYLAVYTDKKYIYHLIYFVVTEWERFQSWEERNTTLTILREREKKISTFTDHTITTTTTRHRITVGHFLFPLSEIILDITK